MTGVVDYGMGNICSVRNALELMGAEVKLCSRPEELSGVERIVLPGVGAFRDCVRNLSEKGFVQALDESRRRGRPILGICLGMQAMARRSYEGGEYPGLGWFDGDVVRLRPDDPELRVPQIGWNEVRYRRDSPPFAGLPPAPDFYFVHSYHVRCDRAEDVIADCDYGGTVTAALCKENLLATQFHPEKSQEHGLRLLANFLGWKP
jgi:imidazole glycerol-phosphate synthase subunit HisH